MKTIKKDQHGFHVMPAVIVLAVIGVVVSGVLVYNRQQNKEAALSEKTDDPNQTLQELPNDLLTVEKVKEIAANEKPDTTVIGIQLERENGVLLYKITLADGTELFVNAQTGAAVAHIEEETEDDDGDKLPGNFTAGISFSRAREIALTKRPGKIVNKIELEVEDGVVVYSVRFTDKSRVDVNATNGEVLRVKVPSSTSGGESNGEDSSSEDDTDSTDVEDEDEEVEDETESEDEEDGSEDDNSGSSSR